MAWQDDDPHGVQKLLALLRSQQDGGEGLSGAKTAPEEVKAGRAEPAWSSNSSNVNINNINNHNYSIDRSPNRLPAAAARDDVRQISFAQALPHLTRLSKNEAFLASLLRLKEEQDRAEERLAREREEFRLTKGSPFSSSALASWDREALRRWDNMHHEQQKQLQAWGVPCFFETSDPLHLKKQAKVFDVLYGLLE